MTLDPTDGRSSSPSQVFPCALDEGGRLGLRPLDNRLQSYSNHDRKVYSPVATLGIAGDSVVSRNAKTRETL